MKPITRKQIIHHKLKNGTIKTYTYHVTVERTYIPKRKRPKPNQPGHGTDRTERTIRRHPK